MPFPRPQLNLSPPPPLSLEITTHKPQASTKREKQDQAEASRKRGVRAEFREARTTSQTATKQPNEQAERCLKPSEVSWANLGEP